MIKGNCFATLHFYFTQKTQILTINSKEKRERERESKKKMKNNLWLNTTIDEYIKNRFGLKWKEEEMKRERKKSSCDCNSL